MQNFRKISIFWIFRSFGYFDLLAVDLLTVDLILCRPFVVRPYWLNPNFDLLSVDLLSVDLLSVDLLPWYHIYSYILGDFFTDSSGHPVRKYELRESELSRKMVSVVKTKTKTKTKTKKTEGNVFEVRKKRTLVVNF
jgi:hypothetical protein